MTAPHDRPRSLANGAYHAVFEACIEAVAIVDKGGTIVDCNAATERLTGLARADLVGSAFFDLPAGAPEDRARYSQILERLLAGEAVEPIEFSFRRPDGGERVVMATVGLLYDGSDPWLVEVLARDVTDQRCVEAQRAELEAKLMQAQRLEIVGRLASGVAHEINNPVNIIMNYAQIIRDRAEPESPFREFAIEMLEECKRIGKIVRSLLAFAREERSGRNPIHVSEFVDGALSLIEARLADDGIVVHVQVPQDLPLVSCHRQQMQQVLLNILTNARDALNARYSGSHADKRIEIRSSVLDGPGHRWVRTTVEDHGGGLAPEAESRIFEPFFTTKERGTGRGLGLAISHGIVAEHGGSLTAESRPGEFTRIHIDLLALSDAPSPGSEAP